MKSITPLAFGLATAALATSAAHAANYDVSPLISEAVSDIVVPVLLAVVPTVGAILVLPVKRYLDQRSGDLLAKRVDDLLDKAIAFAALQAQGWVTRQDFHANVDGWIANIAAAYAVDHAPKLMKKAGVVAGAWAGTVAKDEAGRLLKEKIAARAVGHADVQAVKAMADVAAVPALAAAA